jgi:hypothetical protein
MLRHRLVVVIPTSILIVGCSTDVTFENLSSDPIHGVRWVLKEEPEVAIDVGTVAPRTLQPSTLPNDFGESSLWVGAIRRSELLVTECGYIESGGSYSAAATIQADGPITCKVSLNGY